MIRLNITSISGHLIEIIHNAAIVPRENEQIVIHGKVYKVGVVRYMAWPSGYLKDYFEIPEVEVQVNFICNW